MATQADPDYDYVGNFNTVIVGIRYYTGQVGDNEVCCYHLYI